MDVAWGITAASVTPQSWITSPEWVVAARYAGDMYVDATWLTYTNPVSWAATW